MSNCIEQLQIQRYGGPGYISDRGSKSRQSAPGSVSVGPPPI